MGKRRIKVYRVASKKRVSMGFDQIGSHHLRARNWTQEMEGRLRQADGKKKYDKEPPRRRRALCITR